MAADMLQRLTRNYMFQGYALFILVVICKTWSLKAAFGILAMKLLLYFYFVLHFCLFDINYHETILASIMYAYLPWTGDWDSEKTCEEFQLWRVIDTLNIYFRHIYTLELYIFPYNIPMDICLRKSDYLNLGLYFCIFLLFPKRIRQRFTRKALVPRRIQNKVKQSKNKEFEPEIDWLHHSCLYGHKENVKKILDKNSKTLDINHQVLDGNTPLHLAAFGNHGQIVQILIDKLSKKIDFALQNSDKLSPLELAIQRNSASVIKILLKYSKVELTALTQAIKLENHDLVSKIARELQFQMKSQPDVSIWIERFVEVSKELENKKTSKERKIVCRNNLDIYKNQICIRIAEMTNTSTKQETVKKLDSKKLVEGYTNAITEFECPVCLELMSAPKTIYGCSNDHWICSNCLGKVSMCPQCNENFSLKKPNRRRHSEKMLADFLSE